MGELGRRRPPTMADVAELAGVSMATVSRVMSGKVPVKEAKRQRVLDAIATLRFRPSGAARVLASNRAEVILVLTGNTSRYGYAETIRGIEVAAREAGYSVMISVVETENDVEVERVVSFGLVQSIAGVAVLKFDPPGVAALKQVPESMPTVAISGIREVGVPQAVLDETRAAEELTGYLLKLGHETVHHVRVPPSRREDGRTTGWRRALRRSNAPVPEIFDASWDPESGRAIGRKLATRADVTAVFCGNDEIAMGVIRGLADEGVRVPMDVSVAGFDDHPLAQMWMPSLTTVRQDFFGLGQRGLRLLLDLIENGEAASLSSERPELVARESVAPPRLRATEHRPAAG